MARRHLIRALLPLLLLAGLAACTGPARRQAGEAADALAEALLLHGKREAILAVGSGDEDLERVVTRFAGPAERLERSRLIQAGPDLWSARYTFAGLRLRDPVTGRVLEHEGVLLVEVRLTADGPWIRHAVLSSPGLPPKL